MKIYQVQAPDGSIIKIEGPEGATDDQLIQAAQAAFASKPAAQPMPTYDPTEGMSGGQKFLAGVGKAMTDVGRGAGQMLGLVSREDVARSRALDAPLMRTGAGMVGNIAGNVATMAPAALIPGANTMLGASAIGAASGFLQPSTSTGETASNLTIGGIAGAAIPAMSAALRGTKSLVEPFYQGGREQILGRALRSSAGDKADEAMRAFSQAKGATPGVQPTVGMAARDLNLPSFAAMERATQAVNPDVTNAVGARTAANQQAMADALRNAAGDETALQALLADRSGMADVAYRTARQSDEMRRGMAMDSAVALNQSRAGLGSLANLPNINDARAASQSIRPTKALEDLAQRPAMQRLINQAKTLAANKGEDIGNPLTSLDGLHYVKLALYDALEFNPVNALGRNEKSALTSIKNTLIKEMDEISPVYGQARQNFAEASRPINQMQLGQEIAKKVTNPHTGDIMPSMFSRAMVNDDLARNVTGMPNATMANTLSPDQISSLRGIENDLRSMTFARDAGRGAGSDTVQKLAYTNMLQQAGVPTFLQNFAPTQIVGNLAQRGMGLAYGEANQRLAGELAEAMMNPQLAAELMKTAKGNPQAQKMLANALRSSAVLGASAPAITQGQQQ